MFRRLFRASPHREAAAALYEQLVAQARQPAFYSRCGVPDSLDGRYELIVLHAFLLFRRLKQDHAATADLAQELFDVLFLDMDRSLREIGVGDLGVGKRVKRMAQGFYGRIEAYEAGLAGEEAGLAAALRRNLFGTVAPEQAQLAAVAGYLRREAAALAGQDAAALMAGRVVFGAPPDPGHPGAGLIGEGG
ncbi:MAG: ubiquinol-cytochrome C chaperone family protein [Kiloniellales bacterium]